MKKLLFFFYLFFTTMIVANAQSTRFGFTAGTSIANYKTKLPGFTFTNDPKTGFTVGILVDIPAGSSFSIQPALNYVQKGSKWEDAPEKETISVNCLELPVNFLYNSNSTSGSFFAGAGPSFAFNMSGTSKYDDGSGEEKEDLEFGSDEDNDNMKSMDVGANFLAGYQFSNGLFFSAGYNVGLSNLLPGGDNDASIKSSYFSIKIGLMLKGKK